MRTNTCTRVLRPPYDTTRASDVSQDTAKSCALDEARATTWEKLERQDVCNGELECQRMYLSHAGERLRKARDAAAAATEVLTKDVEREGERVAVAEITAREAESAAAVAERQLAFAAIEASAVSDARGDRMHGLFACHEEVKESNKSRAEFEESRRTCAARMLREDAEKVTAAEKAAHVQTAMRSFLGAMGSFPTVSAADNAVAAGEIRIRPFTTTHPHTIHHTHFPKPQSFAQNICFFVCFL